MRIRTQRTLLRSAARTTATATSAALTGSPQGNATAVGPHFDYEAQTLRAYLNVTVASGTGGLTLQLRGYDKASGASYVLAATAGITATGLYLLEIAPALVAGSGNRATFNGYLPVQWDLNVAVGDASSYTYSLSVETTS